MYEVDVAPGIAVPDRDHWYVTGPTIATDQDTEALIVEPMVAPTPLANTFPLKAGQYV